ncbi:MAG TPA: MarR family transcriptional regulator [Ktedonobacteraceae bacterium]|jgi:DNA-binding MarR family transcriptional regulator|nr:MarR family transcriptional regulator [Ktedonobacteraceae bacterium]
MNETDPREIVTIAHEMDNWYASLGRQFGPLSRPQRRMLRLLSPEQGRRVGDLGEELGLTTAGTTRMLDKLEALGYAERARDQSSDQRQVYVTLTPAGKRALSEADAIFFARVRSTLEGLDEGERAMLARLLCLMNRHAPAQDLPSKH